LSGLKKLKSHEFGAGTPPYMAPEVHLGKKITNKHES